MVGLGSIALLGFDFPGDVLGMSDFTLGVLLKLVLDRSQNYALHFICITFHLHYI